MSSPAIDIDQTPIEINFSSKTSAVTGRRILTAALTVPAVGATIAIAVVIALAAKRIPYPYELDWLETGMLEHVRRLVDGQPLYTQPSVSFTQFPYAPVSFGVGALFSEIFGVHLWVMRGISFASFLGTLLLIHWLIRKETQSHWSGFIAAGIYAGTYKLTGTWFDIGKADDLFLFLTLGAIALARRADSKKTGVLAGAAMAMAVMTKQTAIFAFISLAVYLIITRRPIGIAFTLSGLILGGGTTLILNLVSHGWFDYYVWELLFQHQVVTANRLDFIRIDMKPFWPVIFLVLVALPQLFAKEKRWSTGFYIFALSGLIAGAWSSRLHSGGSFNVLMPAFAAAAIALGISLGTLLERPQRVLLILSAIVLVCAQFWFVRYHPESQLPTATDRATGDQFITWLHNIKGPVFIYSHPTYAVMAGKPDFASEGGSEDVLRGKTLHAKADFERSLADAIHKKEFSAIILDTQEDKRGFPSDFSDYYVQLPGSAVSNDNAWKPIDLETGHPRDVYVPIGSHNISLPLPGPTS